MSGEEEQGREIFVLKASQLLLEADSLMREIQEMLSCFDTTDLSRLRWREMSLQECPASTEEDRGTLLIEGFRFESTANRENLRKLSSNAGVGICQGDMARN